MTHIKWTQDEIIIAMAYYLRHNYKNGGFAKSKIDHLSNLFRYLHISLGADLNTKQRSSGSIKAKLENFKTLDPEYMGKGLPNISKTDLQNWNQFYNNQDYLFKLADIIEQNLITLSQHNNIDLPKVDAEQYVFEGKLLARIHHYLERNNEIIKLKKQWAYDTYGRLHCEACAFDFHEFYGDYGQGFIECHHNIPLAELHIDETQTTALDDLSLLCANCHRMVHYKTPWETVAEIRYMITP